MTHIDKSTRQAVEPELVVVLPELVEINRELTSDELESIAGGMVTTSCGPATCNIKTSAPPSPE